MPDQQKFNSHGADKLVVLSGMPFKVRPATSDLRGSSSVNIARKLFAAGYSLRLYDFVTPADDLKNLRLGTVFENLSAACEGAAALLVLDAWQVCKKIDSASTLENFLLEEANNAQDKLARRSGRYVCSACGS